MTHPEIRRATAKDATRTAELIADAFFTLDATAWLIPNSRKRADVLSADFEIYVEHAMTCGEAHLVEDAVGDLIAAAVWFHPITGPTPEPDDYDQQLEAACGVHVDQFRMLDQLFDDNHPRVYPHHHLAYLATRPNQQRRGLGSTLLRHHHRRLDHIGIPAFLQASSQQSRTLYERHGYKGLGDPFHLPDGTPFWSMWREPSSPETNTGTGTGDRASTSDSDG